MLCCFVVITFFIWLFAYSKHICYGNQEHSYDFINFQASFFNTEELDEFIKEIEIGSKKAKAEGLKYSPINAAGSGKREKNLTINGN